MRGEAKSVASLLNLTATRRPNGDGRRRLRIKRFFALSSMKGTRLLCLYQRMELTTGVWWVKSSVVPGRWGWLVVSPCAAWLHAEMVPSPGGAVPGGSAQEHLEDPTPRGGRRPPVLLERALCSAAEGSPGTGTFSV